VIFSGTKCDGCGKIKGDSNKWLGVIKNKDSQDPRLTICSPDVLHQTGSIYIELDICGDSCLQKLISEICQRVRNEATESATQ
jgi:hypothetical protein